MFKKAWLLLLPLFVLNAKAQSSAEIFHEIQKLNTHSRVLYLAAHPDDENTAVIAWMSNDKKAKTGYLSLTRGDGGQNLIGTEMGPLLGVLRTQELLAARSIDGGEQFFTRAVDFGYSKTADESLEKWGHDLILNDVVYVIRHFKPDVIITRFPPDKRAGHGHHTSSAMLAIEAYEKASDANFKTESPSEPWQIGSVYWNTSTWWGEDLDSLMQISKLYIKENIGGFDPVLGINYNELGSLARSQHKCQGFGVSISRGERMEYFKLLAGDTLNSTLLENASRSWKDLGMSKKFIKNSIQLEEDFNFKNSYQSIGILLWMRNELMEKKGDSFVDEKIEQIDKLIVMCSGVYFEANASAYTVTTNEALPITLDVYNRKSKLFGTSKGDDTKEPVNGTVVLDRNKTSFKENIDVTGETTNMYWLKNEFSTVYTLDSQSLLLNANNPPLYTIPFELQFLNTKFKPRNSLHIEIPVKYKWSDRVEGEHKRPINITPIASVEIIDKSLIFTKGEEGTVNVRVKHYKNENGFALKLHLPQGWTSTESEVFVEKGSKYQEQLYSFNIKASAEESVGVLYFTIDGEPASTLTEISYNHIPTQLVSLPAKVKAVSLDLKIKPGKVAYIEGAGDEVAEAIEQMGFEIELLDKSTLASADLNDYQAIVIGIRAYNVHSWLFDYHNQFMEYVKNGGNMIVQYNTRSRWSGFDASKIGPFPFEIGRKRVSEEDAKATILAPEHNLFNVPNKITPSAFEGWVQERGLYFAQDYESNYSSLISWHDKGEEAQKGGLIFTNYGKGSFIYTGISFFRELPAGVPGAYKLLANMLSYGEE